MQVKDAGRFSMVIPCFNEEAAVPHLVGQLQKLIGLLKDAGAPPPRVIFVNDGSADRTAQVLEAERKKLPDTEVVNLPQNRGLGAAVREGFARAEDTFVVVYESDCNYPIEHILLMFELMDDSTDVIAASPYAPGGSCGNVVAHRLYLSRAASFLYRIILWPHMRGIYTISAVFRLYRRAAFMKLKLRNDRYLFGAEVTYTLLLSGARIKEIPSFMRPRQQGASKMKLAQNILDHLGLMGRILLHRLGLVD
ncbi:MAG: hypothetical protein A3G34_12800 [Candidatus Lindowbacteria bacterium RIFCSPLOWO2_12_FULL_62_27]|nr:MAG: hypothetical protein A3I06_15265 [Candidatus Lindowbacteria bacterium RIFCSPLOWO2_02_FULL_62_12]OGH62473.1 MAG: hypothetical protein A3G34_12800 [Candidatus Lindowbacteria bacterium RIFCSPLOWO2_12_FULL_62_27]